MPQPDSARWYALTITAQKEPAIAALLGTRGVTTFLPMTKVWTRYPRSRSGRYRDIPAVPGYIFVNAPDWRIISQLRDRNRFIHAPIRDIDGTPLPARPDAMTEFMARCANGLAAPQKRGRDGLRVWRKGEMARIGFGPLAGHTGAIAAVSGARASIMTWLFGAEREVAVATAALEVA